MALTTFRISKPKVIKKAPAKESSSSPEEDPERDFPYKSENLLNTEDETKEQDTSDEEAIIAKDNEVFPHNFPPEIADKRADGADEPFKDVSLRNPSLSRNIYFPVHHTKDLTGEKIEWVPDARRSGIYFVDIPHVKSSGNETVNQDFPGIGNKIYLKDRTNTPWPRVVAKGKHLITGFSRPNLIALYLRSFLPVQENGSIKFPEGYPLDSYYNPRVGSYLKGLFPIGIPFIIYEPGKENTEYSDNIFIGSLENGSNQSIKETEAGGAEGRYIFLKIHGHSLIGLSLYNYADVLGNGIDLPRYIFAPLIITSELLKKEIKTLSGKSLYGRDIFTEENASNAHISSSYIS